MVSEAAAKRRGVIKKGRSMLFCAITPLGDISPDRRGVTSLEYAMLAAVVVSVVLAAGAVIDHNITGAFTTVGNVFLAAIGG